MPIQTYKIIIESIEIELQKINFISTKKKGIYHLIINDDITGILGLNIAKNTLKQGWFSVNPIIGLQSKKAEQIYATYNNIKPDLVASSTINTALGYLTDKQTYFDWTFKYQEDNNSIRGDMIKTIIKYGIPFMIENASLEKILANLSLNHFNLPYISEYKILALYYLLEDTDNFIQFFNQKLQSLDSVVEDGFRTYGERLLQNMK